MQVQFFLGGGGGGGGVGGIGDISGLVGINCYFQILSRELHNL